MWRKNLNIFCKLLIKLIMKSGLALFFSSVTYLQVKITSEFKDLLLKNSMSKLKFSQKPKNCLQSGSCISDKWNDDQSIHKYALDHTIYFLLYCCVVPILTIGRHKHVVDTTIYLKNIKKHGKWNGIEKNIDNHIHQTIGFFFPF